MGAEGWLHASKRCENKPPEKVCEPWRTVSLSAERKCYPGRESGRTENKACEPSRTARDESPLGDESRHDRTRSASFRGRRNREHCTFRARLEPPEYVPRYGLEPLEHAARCGLDPPKNGGDAHSLPMLCPRVMRPLPSWIPLPSCDRCLPGCVSAIRIGQAPCGDGGSRA
jgi:hypothetical protein